MGQPEPDADEVGAVLRLVAVLRATGCCHRGGTTGARDFDIHVEGEPDQAVEITTVGLGEGRTLLHARRKHVLRCPGLRSSWRLSVPPTTRMDRLAAHEAEIADALTVLEDAGEPEFGLSARGPAYPLRDRSPAVRAAQQTLRTLGVRHAKPFDSGSTPTITVTPFFESVDDDFDDNALASALQAELDKPDNRRKLAGSGLPRRHLVVVIDFVGRLDLMPSHFDTLPNFTPTLPAEVTDLWVLWSTSPGNPAWSYAGGTWRLWPRI